MIVSKHTDTIKWKNTSKQCSPTKRKTKTPPPSKPRQPTRLRRTKKNLPNKPLLTPHHNQSKTRTHKQQQQQPKPHQQYQQHQPHTQTRRRTQKTRKHTTQPPKHNRRNSIRKNLRQPRKPPPLHHQITTQHTTNTTNHIRNQHLFSIHSNQTTNPRLQSTTKQKKCSK